MASKEKVIFYDCLPANKDAMLGRGLEPGTVDFAVVMGAPTPKRVLTRGNPVVGQKSVDLVNLAFQTFSGPGSVPRIHWTYMMKEGVAFKKKVPIRKTREQLPGLIQELRLALYGTVLNPKDIEEGFITCPICGNTQVWQDEELCTRCYMDLTTVTGPTVAYPKRVLVQGKDAAEILCPGFQNMTEDHGAMFYNPDIHAYCIPTHDFWSVIYDGAKQDTIWRDLERFFTLPELVEPEYQLTTRWFGIDFSKPIVVDIETTGLEPFEDKITMIGLKNLGVAGPVFIMENPTQEELVEFIQAVEWNRAPVICHNTQFDMHFIYHQAVQREVHADLRDTMLMAFVAGESPLKLKHLTSKFLMRPGSHAFGSIEDYGYLAEDVLATEELYYHFHSEEKNFALDLLHRILPYMVEMRLQGVYADREVFEAIYPDFTDNVEKALGPLNDLMDKAGMSELNFNSTKQVADFLIANGVKLLEKTDAGNYTVSEPVLQTLADQYPVVETVLNYRYHAKQLTFMDSYRDHLKYDGYFHPKMILTGAQTGRLSCKDPNLQQVPRVGPIKLMFRSRYEGGYFGLIDLSQAELRVLALLADDEKFAEALLSADPHRGVASMVYSKDEEEISPTERKSSKAITFGLIYGGSDKGLAMRAGLPIRQVSTVRTQFLATFPGINRFLDTNARDAIKTGIVRSPLGRQRDIRTVLLREGEHGAARKSNNTPIQGTASDIMLYINWASGNTLRAMEQQSRPIFGVHDSAMLDIHPDEVHTTAYSVQQAFWLLNDTPLSDLPLWSYLPIVGEFVISDNWAGTESTSEFYNPLIEFDCSSHKEPVLMKPEDLIWEAEYKKSNEDDNDTWEDDETNEDYDSWG